MLAGEGRSISLTQLCSRAIGTGKEIDFGLALRSSQWLFPEKKNPVISFMGHSETGHLGFEILFKK